MQVFAEVNAPATAPACYAAASVFSHDSNVCRACAAYAGCGDASLQTLQALRQAINVDDLLTRHENAKRRSLKARSKPIEPVQAAPQRAEPEQEPDDEAPQVEREPLAAPAPVQVAPVERKTKVERVALEPTVAETEALATMPKKAREHAERFCRAGLIDAMRVDLQAGRNTFAAAKPEFMRVVCDRLIAGGFDKRSLKDALMTQLSWGDGTATSHVGFVVPILLAFNIATETAGRIALVPCVSHAQ